MDDDDDGKKEEEAEGEESEVASLPLAAATGTVVLETGRDVLGNTLRGCALIRGFSRLFGIILDMCNSVYGEFILQFE